MRRDAFKRIMLEYRHAFAEPLSGRRLARCIRDGVPPMKLPLFRRSGATTSVTFVGWLGWMMAAGAATASGCATGVEPTGAGQGGGATSHGNPTSAGSG